MSPEELCRLYLTEKRSLEDIARLYGASRVAVWKYCEAEQLVKRNRSEARLEAQRKGKVPQNFYAINEKFFREWSPEMAYILGLLITDGNVSDRGTISLCMNEQGLLRKVASAMSAMHNVTPSKHQQGLHMFHFTRVEILKDLTELCVVPRKSMTVRFPEVPEPFLADFIRGVFDGDGSVFFDSRSERYPVRTKFVSSSQAFIQRLEMALQKLDMPARRIYEQPTKNGISYMFRYGHKDSEKLYRIMYANGSLFLERKYQKFHKGGIQ